MSERATFRRAIRGIRELEERQREILAALEVLRDRLSKHYRDDATWDAIGRIQTAAEGLTRKGKR